MNLDQHAIGASIRARRTEASLTQAELAERLHVSAQSVSNWERGESLPDIATLPDLACILNCSVDMLLGGHSGTFRYIKPITINRSCVLTSIFFN